MSRALLSEKCVRITAVFTVAVMLLAAVLSVSFIFAEAGHDCSGEDCKICETVRHCSNLLRGTKTDFVRTCRCPAFALLLAELCILTGFCVTLRSPVSVKVRLNN
ncbi:MAG: hypothetical protein IJS90_08990 [Clostridia bacterium]|nr:hypothetical protein [Clostridia bacterium]